jgi:hypothetical protein
MLSEFFSIFECERNLQLHPVFRDLSIPAQHDLLILDPGRPEIRECFVSACDSGFDGIIKTLC